MKKVLLREITLFLARGAAPKYTEKDDFYVLNQKCIRDWRVLLKDARFTDTEAKRVHDDRILRDNDILVNSTGQGTLGRVAQFLKLDRPATVDSHITIVRPNPDLVFPEYLGYVLKGRQNEIELLAEGSTGQTELSKLKLANLSIDLPPLDQQKKIADILSSLDEKIELNRRMNETLEQLGQTLFRHYFIDNPDAKNWKKRSLGEFFRLRRVKRMQILGPRMVNSHSSHVRKQFHAHLVALLTDRLYWLPEMGTLTLSTIRVNSKLTSVRMY